MEIVILDKKEITTISFPLFNLTDGNIFSKGLYQKKFKKFLLIVRQPSQLAVNLAKILLATFVCEPNLAFYLLVRNQKFSKHHFGAFTKKPAIAPN